MKKKILLKNVSCMLLLLSIFFASITMLSACDFNYYYEIAISSSVYDDGEQVINLYFTNENDSTTFKSTISIDDIKFEGDLVGRTATKVEILSSRRLEITLGGKCSVSSTVSSKNRIVVLSNATSDSKNYAINVSVLESGLTSSSNENTMTGDIGTFTSNFKTTSGASFEEVYIIESYITITNGTGHEDIDIDFDRENQTVTVTISYFTVTDLAPKPIVQFSAETTTLNKIITVSVG
ncbi:MAG: hypothetical protein EOM55_04545 [Clostridia bacterium]|nr:hypothetical protein [Clostridia bacterium]